MSKDKYEKLYSSMRLVENELLRRIADFSIRPMDDACITDWRNQWCKNGSPPVYGTARPFYWDNELAEIESSPVYFGLAMYAGPKLCALIYFDMTPVSAPKQEVILHIVEGAPDKTHPLKGRVIPTVLKIAEDAAQRNAKNYVYAVEPVAEIVDIYRAHGYQYVNDLICGCKAAIKTISPGG